MPKLGISSEEADKLLAFLEWTSKVDNNGRPPKPILPRQQALEEKSLKKDKIYQSSNCSNCHMINGIGGNNGP